METRSIRVRSKLLIQETPIPMEGICSSRMRRKICIALDWKVLGISKHGETPAFPNTQMLRPNPQTGFVTLIQLRIKDLSVPVLGNPRAEASAYPPACRAPDWLFNLSLYQGSTKMPGQSLIRGRGKATETRRGHRRQKGAKRIQTNEQNTLCEILQNQMSWLTEERFPWKLTLKGAEKVKLRVLVQVSRIPALRAWGRRMKSSKTGLARRLSGQMRLLKILKSQAESPGPAQRRQNTVLQTIPWPPHACLWHVQACTSCVYTYRIAEL